jgi:hypothetical protein
MHPVEAVPITTVGLLERLAGDMLVARATAPLAVAVAELVARAVQVVVLPAELVAQGLPALSQAPQ